jgi:predicted Fe-Mo cluster-binding NifX family protein
MTKAAFPIDGRNISSPVVDHFGRAKNFLVFDTKDSEYTVYSNPEAAGKETLPPNFLHEKGVQAVVCFGLGHRAVELFEKLDVSLYKAVSGTVEDNLEQFKEGKLSKF